MSPRTSARSGSRRALDHGAVGIDLDRERPAPVSGRAERRGHRIPDAGGVAEREHRRPGPAERHAVRARAPRRVEDLLQAGDQPRPVRLVQSIPRRLVQHVGAAGGQRRHEERGPGHVEHRVRERDLGRQEAPRLLGRDGEVRHREHHGERRRRDPRPPHAVGRPSAGDEAAQERRGGVVRVSLDLGRQVEQRLGGDRAAEDRRGAAPEPAGERDAVVLHETERPRPPGPPARPLDHRERRAVGEVRGGPRQRALALPPHLDRRGLRLLQLERVVEAQGYAHRVEPRPQVRRARRHADPDHSAASGSAPSRSSASSVAGTASGRLSVRSTASGSLRPWPVSTHATTAPAGSRPSRARLRRPATGAADEGSTNTPSSRASSARAASSSSSVTASNAPPDSRTAAHAASHEAGRPMRIADATVSGRATGWPTTNGAAPAAWNPHIRGRAPTRPARWYSTKPRQYAVMLPALPTGIASTSGARPSTSQISKAPVFWPSIRYGLTEFTRVRRRRGAPSRTIRSASSNDPSMGMTRAPWARACTSFPSATPPAGTTTKHGRPARAAYAAADADVFPVLAHTTARLPSSSAFVIASVMPRSLNEPVGLAPSHLRKTSTPGV